MIAVVGSANVDHVLHVTRLPAWGETLAADRLEIHEGGKGANQAVAAARLGEDVAFFGAVGQDRDGDHIMECLQENAVDTGRVLRASVPTGRAIIWVDPAGENAITIVPGANANVDAAYVDSILGQLLEADIILLQLEIPLPTISHLLALLPAKGPRVLVDPAPAAPFAQAPFRMNRVDILTPNVGELLQLSGQSDVRLGAEWILNQSVDQVIVTRGAQGASLFSGNGMIWDCPAPRIKPVDTTASGDAFSGALAASLAQGASLKDAIQRGVHAGALSATRHGAIPSLPTRAELRAFMEREQG